MRLQLPIPLLCLWLGLSFGAGADAADLHDSAFHQFARSLCEQGIAEQGRGDHRGAITFYTRAILIEPDNPVAYEFRGRERMHISDYKGALSDFEQAIPLWTKPDSYAYYFRGWARDLCGKYTDARVDFDKAILLDSKNGWAYVGRGRLKSYKGTLEGYKESMVDYDHAVRVTPKLISAYTNRAWSRDELGDKLGAISDYDKAIGLGAEDSMVYHSRGFARFDLGDYSSAINDAKLEFGIVQKNSLSSWPAYFLMGRAKLALGDYRGTVECFDQVVSQLGSISPNAYDYRGQAKFAQGDCCGGVIDRGTCVFYNFINQLDWKLRIVDLASVLTHWKDCLISSFRR